MTQKPSERAVIEADKLELEWLQKYNNKDYSIVPGKFIRLFARVDFILAYLDEQWQEEQKNKCDHSKDTGV